MKKKENVSQYGGPLKAVIFDWAGTVIDYGSCAPAVAFVEVFHKNGVEITMAEAREPMGMAKRDHIAAILQMPAVRDRWKIARGALPSEEDANYLYEQFLPAQLQCLRDYGELIPGAVETVAECRRRSMKIGSSTGYTKMLMEVVMSAAARQGFVPDSMTCADDIGAGRPAPWMCFENARRMDVFPPAAVVKVDDTPVGIEAGRNAGMWTVGVTASGNLVGLTRDQVQQLDPAELARRCDRASERLFAAGAHYVIESVAELPSVLDDIEAGITA
ncbi:MAG: phosphonoacetaldehyde hydrolase [Pirellulales bacterium]